MATPRKFNGQVVLGDQSGRTIGFPTLNFDPSIVSSGKLSTGVYSSEVIIGGRSYEGVLYYGPRLVKGENRIVLEIHVLDFSENVYGQIVRFTIGKYIRAVMAFTSMEELKRQIEKDIAAVRASS